MIKRETDRYLTQSLLDFLGKQTEAMNPRNERVIVVINAMKISQRKSQKYNDLYRKRRKAKKKLRIENLMMKASVSRN